MLADYESGIYNLSGKDFSWAPEHLYDHGLDLDISLCQNLINHTSDNTICNKAVGAICIDKTKIFLMSPCSTQYILQFITSRRCARQCILLRSICLRIAVQYILAIEYVARSWAQCIFTDNLIL